MAEVLAIGVSHKTAPLELRERMALTEGHAAGLLGELTTAEVVQEAATISTCNRTEIYLYATDGVAAESLALAALAREADIRPTELVGHLYSLRGSDAAEHLFTVTAGLDSMIIGETEIQGQVKRSYELALVEGATGPVLNGCFAVRWRRASGHVPRPGSRRATLSVPQVAVELAQRTLGRSRRAAGCWWWAPARQPSSPRRPWRRAASRPCSSPIAATTGPSASRSDSAGTRSASRTFPLEMVAADIVTASTSSPHHVIERDELTEVMSAREGRPLLLIDLAVPRDIHPDCREVPGVTLQDMDDLQSAGRAQCVRP